MCAVEGVENLVNGSWQSGTIENVLYVPSVKKNLFSVGAVCTVKGFCVKFGGSSVIVERNRQIMATGARQSNQIFRMFFRVPRSCKEINVSVTNIKVWHERLGHINQRSICELVKKGLVEGVTVKDTTEFFCHACQLGKLHKLPFDKPVVKVNRRPGEFVHSDVCGPMQTRSLGGAEYFVTFKDDATAFRHVYFLKHKADVLYRFIEFERMLSNKFGRSIKTLRADNGCEYCNKKMREYLASRGIKMENTAPYTPAQNGRSERDNRTIVKSARTLLQAKNLPTNLWAEAVNTTVYTLNRTGRSEPGGSKTSYEIWMGKKPDLRHMRIFGSVAYLHTLKQFVKKFDARSKKTILVGYQEDSSNYRLYNKETRTVSVSRDVIFDKRVATSEQEETKTSEVEVTFPTRPEDDEEEEVDNGGVEEAAVEETAVDNAGAAPVDRRAQQTVNEPRVLRSREHIRPPARYDLNLVEYPVPSTFQEAINGPEASKWAEAIKEELEAHERNETWSVVPKVTSKQTIDSKWVFKILRDTNGGVCRFKARLCARGFLQREGVDYSETFSPVVRYDTLRVLLAIITQLELEMVQFDVRTAFLHGKLQEEIHMEVQEGLNVNELVTEASKSVSVVCKLNKSLYGLKQAPRCWNVKFSSFLRRFNLKETDADKCIFFGNFKGCDVYLALFVDDGIVAAKSTETLKSIIKSLSETFEITVGDCSSFVGLQICQYRVNNTMFVHQNTYTREIIEKFGMKNSKGMCIPADHHNVLCPVESDYEEQNNVPYREAVGSLMSLAVVSRPDIAFAVNSVSRFLNRHSKCHW